MASKVILRVDEFIRETGGSWHCQFADLEKPTYIPKRFRGETFARVSENEFECPGFIASKTAEALNVDVSEITVPSL